MQLNTVGCNYIRIKIKVKTTIHGKFASNKKSMQFQFIFNFSRFNFHLFHFSYNLYELIKKNNYQGFSLSLIRRFCNSIIKCLRLLYQEQIIHCDLKPVCRIVMAFMLNFFPFVIPHCGIDHYKLNLYLFDLFHSISYSILFFIFDDRRTFCSNSVAVVRLR